MASNLKTLLGAVVPPDVNGAAENDESIRRLARVSSSNLCYGAPAAAVANEVGERVPPERSLVDVSSTPAREEPRLSDDLYAA